MGVIQPLFAVHETVAVVEVFAPSTSASGVLRTAPVALFQCVCGTTPALSAGAINAVLVPRKLIPIEIGTGTICRPLMGARTLAFVLVPGVAVTVKAVLLILNLT